MLDHDLMLEAGGSSATIQSNPASFVEIILQRAKTTPEAIALNFYTADGYRTSLSYGLLAQRCQAIAAVLQRVTKPGDRALLLYPPGLGYVEAFFGCLFAGVIAVPAYPPRPNRRDQRLEAIISNAQARVMLAASEVVAQQRALSQQYPGLAQLQWIASDLVNSQLASMWQAPSINTHDLAFLQYTSGSTSQPRGVMVSHENLVYNSGLIAQSFGITADDHVFIWLPPYHDMGLIGGIMQPLFTGCELSLIDPLTFLQQPLIWLRMISDLGVTVTGGPNFAYDLCVAKAKPEALAGVDLSRLRVAFNGAEPIRAATLERFSRTFAPLGFKPQAFLPCYGLAEATLFVSGAPHAAEPTTLTVDAQALSQHQALPSERGTLLVSSGMVAAPQIVAIVDPEQGQVCADGWVGEVCIHGRSIAHGYWDNSAASEATFQLILPDGSGPFLRTGDLGFIHEGQLYITGRLKDLIIIDGRNHYPQDLELSVELAHPAIRQGGCAAFAVDGADGEQIVIVAEIRRPNQAEEAAQAVRLALQQQYDLAIADLMWVRPGQVPKTSSGKVRRRECRQRYLSQTLNSLEGEE
ncbi:fatty acyl-AMP ligase [Herpetosiphon sp.]|uniref:AMP-dependent synthetase and ligase n=1 Tax=Herpetosiphon aurantiacus (strain ATCC 23779 / DSM 785 / 114-95) TaxID=316274 RepID=A9B7X1_HERA2|nr:fatty acyl-AMP ligase [Herpetosiphon sp.]ABX04499.1 AMP-dependent synthetase and ligase [Herpetosiphon aurantiacus DSM 785]